MEYEKIKQLMEDMSTYNIQTLNIDFPDGSKISMQKEVNEKVNKSKEIKENEEKYEINEKGETDTNNEDSTNIITSPMVGTFYIKPSPNSEPYVEIGSKIKKGQTVCIIEAMKLMNEIESEFDGEIAEILVKDGEAVEYGKPLFRIN